MPKPTPKEKIEIRRSVMSMVSWCELCRKSGICEHSTMNPKNTGDYPVVSCNMFVQQEEKRCRKIPL